MKMYRTTLTLHVPIEIEAESLGEAQRIVGESLDSGDITVYVFEALDNPDVVGDAALVDEMFTGKLKRGTYSLIEVTDGND